MVPYSTLQVTVQEELSQLMVGTTPTMDGSKPGDAM